MRLFRVVFGSCFKVDLLVHLKLKERKRGIDVTLPSKLARSFIQLTSGL